MKESDVFVYSNEYNDDIRTNLISAQDQRIATAGLKLSIDEALERAGGFGIYQVFTLVVSALGYVSFGYLSYNLFYYELMP